MRSFKPPPAGTRSTAAALLAFAGVVFPGTAAVAQQPLAIRLLAEKAVPDLPAGELYWRIEKLGSLAQATGLSGPWSLAVEAEGQAWLFTLGPRGASSTGATRVAEVGPIERVPAGHWLLRINEASGPPGAVTPVHSHPGSEAFYVLDGEQSIRGPHGTMRVAAGQSEPGHGGGEPMQVSSTGSSALHALVMFLVDADKPFSSPATLP